MTPRIGDYLVIAPPILLVSGLALYWAEAPYGWLHVLVVYLLATFPLSVLLADWLAARADPRVRAAAGAVFGIGLVVTTALAGRYFTLWLQRQEADLFVRQATLGMWCVLLQLLLCLSGRWIHCRLTLRNPPPAPSWAAVGLALLVAASLPAVYVARVIETESRKAEEHIVARRWGKASALAEKLSELGSQRPLAGLHPVVVSLAYPLRVNSLIQRRLPTTDSERVEEAKWHASRGEYDEAVRLLRPLTGHDPAAVLLLASFYKEQEKWKECGQYCKLALALLDKLPQNEQTLPGWVDAYDNLAAAALEQKKYDEGRAIYEAALRRVTPASAPAYLIPAQAYFHFKLGQLHHSAGRPGKALHHLQEALTLDPEIAERVRPVMDEIRLHTPGCLLRWWGR